MLISRTMFSRYHIFLPTYERIFLTSLTGDWCLAFVLNSRASQELMFWYTETRICRAPWSPTKCQQAQLFMVEIDLPSETQGQVCNTVDIQLSCVYHPYITVLVPSVVVQINSIHVPTALVGGCFSMNRLWHHVPTKNGKGQKLGWPDLWYLWLPGQSGSI